MNNALIVYPNRLLAQENLAYSYLRHKHGVVGKCVKDKQGRIK